MVDLAEFKKFFLFNLIGSLIISAIIAVITVLIGNFSEVTGRVFLTLFMVIIHSLVCLAFIWDDERQNTFERLAFFTNVLFFLIVFSFITSILGVWKIIPEETVVRLYATYFILGFAALHGDILSKALNKENYIDLIVYLNYIFMAIVVLMLLPVIYLDNPFKSLGEVYFRLLGAAGIVDGTLSILTIIFYRLYMHNHPKVEDNLATGVVQEAGAKTEKRRGLSIWVWILIVYLVIQIASLLSVSIFRIFR